MCIYLFLQIETLYKSESEPAKLDYLCMWECEGRRDKKRSEYTFHTWNNISALYMQKVNLNQHEQEKQTHLYFK